MTWIKQNKNIYKITNGKFVRSIKGRIRLYRMQARL